MVYEARRDVFHQDDSEIARMGRQAVAPQFKALTWSQTGGRPTEKKIYMNNQRTWL